MIENIKCYTLENGDCSYDFAIIYNQEGNICLSFGTDENINLIAELSVLQAIEVHYLLKDAIEKAKESIKWPE